MISANSNRHDGRNVDQLRDIKIERSFTRYADFGNCCSFILYFLIYLYLKLTPVFKIN